MFMGATSKAEGSVRAPIGPSTETERHSVRGFEGVPHFHTKRQDQLATGPRKTILKLADDIWFAKESNMMGLAQRISRLGTETAFEVLAAAKAMEAQSRKIIHLEIGELSGLNQLSSRGGT